MLELEAIVAEGIRGRRAGQRDPAPEGGRPILN
jgi:hypothetical protein